MSLCRFSIGSMPVSTESSFRMLIVCMLPSWWHLGFSSVSGRY